jgi:cold-inducible RNA-binding protein
VARPQEGFRLLLALLVDPTEPAVSFVLVHSAEDRQLGYPEWWFETRFPGTALRLAFVISTTHMKLYVGNLSFDTTENDLRTLFSDFGTVTDIYLVSDRATGNSRGFAFVTLSSASEGAAAINGLAGREFSGRSLTVNEARPKEDRPRRSFAGSRR